MARVNAATATNSFFDKMTAFRPPILPQLAAWLRQMKQAVHLRDYVMSEYEDAKKSGRSQNFA
jgi:hypothetical protein